MSLMVKKSSEHSQGVRSPGQAILQVTGFRMAKKAKVRLPKWC